MDSFTLPLVLEAVSQLEIALGTIGTCTEELAVGAAIVATPSTVIKIRGAYRRATYAVDMLRERLLDDIAEDPSLEHREWAFRARAIVLALQMPELTRHERTVQPRLAPGFGRFRSIGDVCAHILDRIGDVNAKWLGQRRAIDTARVEDKTVRERAYVAAVASAERGLRDIGMDADIACFLAAGASVSSSSFRTACRVIAALLDVSLAPSAVVSMSAQTPNLAQLTFRLSLQAEDEQ